jgi:hypothetical protein
MIFRDSDAARVQYNGYMEPLLLTGAAHIASRLGITRSKYIRFAVIRALIRDGYPLGRMSSKFKEFYKYMSDYT